MFTLYRRPEGIADPYFLLGVLVAYVVQMRLSDLQAYYYDSGLLNRNVSGAGDGLSAVVPRGLPNPWINPFQITRSEFRPLVAAALAETVLYGIHIVLYVFSSCVLLRAHRRLGRNRHRHHHRHHSHNTDNRSPLPSGGSAVIVNDRHIDMTSRRRLRDYIPNFLKLQTRLRIRISLQLISFLAATIMFILATADIGVSYSIILNHYGNYVDGLENTQDFLTMVYPKFLIHLVNNVIADALLITRCYILWTYNRVLGLGSAFLLLAGTVLGFVGEATSSPPLKVLVGPYIVVAFFLNLMLTALTAGRIWWIARRVGRVMGRQVIKPYNLTVGILLESGFIYSAAIISLLVLSPTAYVVVGATICIRMVCIMPIFLVVHVALGRGTQNLEMSISAARSNDVQLSSALHFRTSISTGVAALESSNNRNQTEGSSFRLPNEEIMS